MIKDEQTITNLKKLKSFHNGSYGADIDRAIEVLEQEPRWIPVSEMLPETDKWRTTFDVTIKTGKVTSMEWENTTVRGKPVSRWVWQDRIPPWEVIAWMPLPQPYKAESEGKE